MNMFFDAGAEERPLKPRVCAIVAGVFFSTAWWVIIGGSVDPTYGPQINGEYYLPLIFQVVSFFMINLISWEALDAANMDMYDDGRKVLCVNRSIFLCGVLIQLTALVFSVFIMVTDYADPVNEKNPGSGVTIILSNMLLFLSTWLMRYGSIPNEYE